MDDGVHGIELWRTDGTPAGTFQVTDLRPGPVGSNVSELIVFNGKGLLPGRRRPGSQPLVERRHAPGHAGWCAPWRRAPRSRTIKRSSASSARLSSSPGRCRPTAFSSGGAMARRRERSTLTSLKPQPGFEPLPPVRDREESSPFHREYPWRRPAAVDDGRHRESHPAAHQLPSEVLAGRFAHRVVQQPPGLRSQRRRARLRVLDDGWQRRAARRC